MPYAASTNGLLLQRTLRTDWMESTSSRLEVLPIEGFLLNFSTAANNILPYALNAKISIFQERFGVDKIGGG